MESKDSKPTNVSVAFFSAYNLSLLPKKWPFPALIYIIHVCTGAKLIKIEHYMYTNCYSTIAVVTIHNVIIILFTVY